MVNFVEPIMPITPSLTFDFAGIELDRKQGLSRQLYQALRQRILDGRLSSGTRLPSSRDLAMALTISRNRGNPAILTWICIFTEPLTESASHVF